MDKPTGLALQLDLDALEPLITRIVEHTVTRLEQARATLGSDKLCYTEAETAAMLGLKDHQLRDERLRGRIRASRIVGRRIRYTHSDVMKYLINRRENGNGATD
jgi:hypothetical protein